MQRLAKLAVGSVQPGADSRFVVWSLMAALEKAGLRVQNFSARACFAPQDAASIITGQPARYLDSWLLEPEGCRALFERGARDCDLALIDGRFKPGRSERDAVGGKLSTLCDWLNLPSIAVIDAGLIEDCELPKRPYPVDGVLIDRPRCRAERCQLQTWVEALWGVPVLGFVEDLPQLRCRVRSLPVGVAPPRDLCDAMADQAISPRLVDQLVKLAIARDPSPQPLPFASAVLPRGRLRIAMAFDDAFHCYFPDALDQLELLGAEICDFSPLRDERLPPNIDLVYFGCGRPELHVHQLRENCCLTAALRRHVEGGGRLYAEGGGLAYLGQFIELPGGQRLPMAGVLPISMSLAAEVAPPQAVELGLATDCLLGETGAMIRGYRTGRWQIAVADNAVINLVEDQPEVPDLIGYHNAIGSRVHLNFAMQPLVLDRIFHSRPQSARAI